MSKRKIKRLIDVKQHYSGDYKFTYENNDNNDVLPSYMGSFVLSYSK